MREQIKKLSTLEDINTRLFNGPNHEKIVSSQDNKSNPKYEAG